MKKIITLTLELEVDGDGFDPSDKEIERDLMAEIRCCCNYYDFLGITVKEAANDG